MILSIWNEMESLYFMVYIKYLRSNNIQIVTLFKILNDETLCILLDLKNKILIIFIDK